MLVPGEPKQKWATRRPMDSTKVHRTQTSCNYRNAWVNVRRAKHGLTSFLTSGIMKTHWHIWSLSHCTPSTPIIAQSCSLKTGRYFDLPLSTQHYLSKIVFARFGSKFLRQMNSSFWFHTQYWNVWFPGPEMFLRLLLFSPDTNRVQNKRDSIVDAFVDLLSSRKCTFTLPLTHNITITKRFLWSNHWPDQNHHIYACLHVWENAGVLFWLKSGIRCLIGPTPTKLPLSFQSLTPR